MATLVVRVAMFLTVVTMSCKGIKITFIVSEEGRVELTLDEGRHLETH